MEASALPAQMVSRVLPVPPVNVATQARPDLQVTSVTPDLRVNQAHRVPQDLSDNPVHPVQLARSVLWVQVDRMVNPVKRVHPGRGERSDLPAIRVLPERREVRD